MTFDSASNLYVVNFSIETITRFDFTGKLIPPNPFFTGDLSPGGETENIIIDSAGDFYIGEQAGNQDILKFSPEGFLLDRFDVRPTRPELAPRFGGSDQVELAPDQTTIYYAGEALAVHRYDLKTRSQLPSYALPIGAGDAHALRLLPDGRLLVACQQMIVLLNQSGQVVRTYTAPNVTDFFGLALDPDGTSFWAAEIRLPSSSLGFGNGVFKFDINSGTILQSRLVGGVDSGYNGMTVFGAYSSGQSRLDVVADDPAPIFTNLSGLAPAIPGQPATFQLQFTGDGDPHSFDLRFVRPESNLVVGSIPVTINTGYLYPVQAVDADGDPLKFSLVEAPTDAAINSQTGRITWSPPAVGTYRFVVQADDGRGGRDAQEYEVVVTSGAPNDPPAITSTAPDEATARLPFEYRVAATDLNGDLLAFFLTQAPAGMAINHATGLITWTPTDSQIGAQSVTVQVIDGRGGETTQTFTLTVFADTGNRAPRIVSPPITTATSGKLYRYVAVATDEDSDGLSFDLVVAPDRMTVDAKSGVIVWRPTAEDVGDHNVIFRVRDGRGGVNLQPYLLTVIAVGSAPCFSTAAPTAPAVVGQPYQYQFRTQDADGDTVSYRLDTSPTDMTIDQTTGLLRWTPTANQAGSQAVIVAATDATGARIRLSFTLQVLSLAVNDPPVIASSPRTSIGLGATYLYQVTASDPNNDPLTVTLQTAPAGMTIDADHLLRWQPAPGQLGDNNVTISVADGRGGFVSQIFTVDVRTERANQPPQIVSTPLLVSTVGRDYHYKPQGVDPDSDPGFWSLTTTPEGMSIQPTLGILCWIPTADQVGPNSVVIQLDDGQGGFTTQAFTIVVRAVNLPPAVVTTPPTRAAVSLVYAYALRADDPDGDTLSFALTASPAGMTIDAATGLIAWTPTTTQLGSQNVAVEVTDGHGGSATQTFTIDVEPLSRNLPPTITSFPVTVAAADLPYIYDVDASDPDGDSLAFTLGFPPAGMTIDPTTGLINWTPTSNQVANHRFTVMVTDEAGNFARQICVLRVQEANHSPAIDSAAVRTATAGRTYRYDVKASDPDGNALAYSLTSPPTGMTIDALGRITWATAVPDIGTHPITVVVTDVLGASVSQSFDLTVSGDSQQASIFVDFNSPVAIGADVIIFVSATDNVGVSELSLTVGGMPLPIDANGQALFHAATAGSFTVQARATDAAGNLQTVSSPLSVFDPTDADAPLATITSPFDEAIITAPTPVRGTVSDGNLVQYTLSLAPLGSSDFVEFARGTTSVIDGVLGTLDPTLLNNDSYTLRLEAIDAGGHIATVEQVVHVEGNLKLGNFTVSFTDVTVPVFGVPITVSRTYDTLTASQSSDFGFGWRLEFRNMNLRTSVAASRFEEFGIFNPFKVGSRVYVTLPGGNRQAFTFQPTVASGLRGGFLGIFEPRFVPDPGVKSSLTVNPADLRISADGRVFDYGTGASYNPASSQFGGSYLLTTKEGIAFDVDGRSGQLTALSDPNNNLLRFTDAGIIGPEGKSISFERDPRGRITAVVDPAGQRIRYRYDARGDLIAVSDRTSNTTQFSYRSSPAHYLETVTDPLGRTGVRTEYDAQGRLIKLIDAAGHPIQLAYDPTQLVNTVTDPLGNTTTEVYDERGNTLRHIDALGAVTVRTFDADNNQLTETDPLGRTTAFTYDERGDVLTETNPIGDVAHYTYEAFTFGITAEAAVREEAALPFTRVRTSTDPLGNTARVNYDRKGNPIAQTDPLGNTTLISNDNSGNPILIEDPLGSVTRNEFAAGHRTRLTDANGHVLNFSYNANGDLLSQTELDGTGWSLSYNAEGWPTKAGLIDLPHSVQYDALQQITQIAYPSGQFAALNYDELGNLTRIVLPDGTQAQTNTYDAVGNLVGVVDSLGNITRYSYDAVYRPVQTVYPDGSTVKHKYDLAGQLVEMTDALGNNTRYAYDGEGRNVQIIDPLGGVTRTQYDAADRIVAVTDALGRTSRFQYDANGQQLATVAPDGSVTQYAYDAGGRLVQTTDAAGRVTTNRYDAGGHLVSVTDALGNLTQFQYGARNERIAIIDARGNTTRFRYDEQGRLIQTIHPLGETEVLTYDSLGHLATTTDGNGQSIHFGYDGSGRLAVRTLPDGSEENFTYTSDGLISSVSNARGTIQYDYDPVMRRLVRVTEPDGTQVSYNYDRAGNRTSLTATVGSTSLTTGYTFDALNRLATVTDPDLGVTKYSYDAVGNLIRAELPNGTFETRSYDDLGRLLFLENRGTTGVISSHRFALTPTGQRASVVEQDGRRSDYTYDALDRLTRERTTDAILGDRTFDYTYDAVGNRLTRNDSAEGLTQYSYDADDRLLTETLAGELTQYTYDDNGNLLSRTSATDRVFFDWDFENRLITVDTDGDGTVDVRNEYDPNGNRVSQTIAAQETHFLVDTQQPYSQVLLEYRPSGLIVASHVYGHGLTSRAQNGARVYYHVDGLGSTRALTDAAGAVLNRYQYDAFGRSLSQTGGTPNPYLFAGEQRDAALGLDYLRARYYDPSTGRFVSRDSFPASAQFPLSLNKYLYALANPVNYRDPSGNITLAELDIVELIQSLLKKVETAVKTHERFQTVNRALQKIGGFLTLATAAYAFFDPERLGGFFGGLLIPGSKGVKSLLAIPAERWLISSGYHMLKLRATYIPVPAFDFNASTSAIAEPDVVRVSLRYELELPPLPRPGSPLENAQVFVLVHEFHHLASKRRITDYLYGINSLLLPPAQALCNADNYEYFVQATVAGLTAEGAFNLGDQKGGNIKPKPEGVGNCL